MDVVDVEQVGEKEKEKAIKAGIPTKEEQEEYLKKEELWSNSKNMDISEAKNYLSQLRSTKSKTILKSKREELEKEIDEYEKRLEGLLSELESLMGFTAEKYAAKKVNSYYIQNVLYKDENLTQLRISDEEFNELDDRRVSELVIQYNDQTSLFRPENFKKIAISPFMSNAFYMVDNDPFKFYGKPVIDLTFFQIEIFTHAVYYKHVMQESKIPPPKDIMNDPEELHEWFESTKNAEPMLDKLAENQGGGVSIVGATADDMSRLGLKEAPGTKSLSKEAAKRGGTLDMEDFLKIHGEG
jgi:hypothetical protein